MNAANRRKSPPRFFGNPRSSEAAAVAGNGRGRKVVDEGEQFRTEGRRGGIVRVKLRERGYAIPVAVEKAMVLLERQSHNLIRIGGCNWRHAQDLTSAAAALARTRGGRHSTLE